MLVDDDTLETQATYQKLEEMRPLARTTYSEVMDFVDVADQHTMGALSTHRKYDWTAAEKLWEVTMLLIVNAKKVHQSATGNLSISGPDWHKKVRLSLMGQKKLQNHPPALKPLGKKNKKGNCVSCDWIKKKTS